MTRYEGVFVSCILDRGVISRTCEELKKQNHKTNDLFKARTWAPNTECPKEDMAKKHTREIQIKTSLRFHCIPVRISKINKIATNSKCWGGCWGNKTLTYCWLDCKLLHPPWKSVWGILRKLKMNLTYDQAASSLPNLCPHVHPTSQILAIFLLLCSQ